MLINPEPQEHTKRCFIYLPGDNTQVGFILEANNFTLNWTKSTTSHDEGGKTPEASKISETSEASDPPEIIISTNDIIHVATIVLVDSSTNPSAKEFDDILQEARLKVPPKD